MYEAIGVLVSGVVQGVPLFLIASGLTLVFGVMGILNFAHGSIFMIGAYVLTTSVGGSSGPLMFLVSVILAVVACAALAGASERVLFQRFYGRDHVITLLASFGLLLCLDGLAQRVWGVVPRTEKIPRPLDHVVEIAGSTITVYNLCILVVGIAVALLMWVILSRTNFGRSAQTVAYDADLAESLGINTRFIYFGVFLLSGALAGLAGALVAPKVSIVAGTGGLSQAFLIECFVIVIVGGLGSVKGAFASAIGLGVADSVVAAYLPVLAGFTMYIAISIILLVRPQGLFGRAEVGAK